jgi:hypothetical protein
VSGFVQVKANSDWEEGCKGMVKKASLRSRAEKWVMVCGMVDRIV